ncbi:MAG: antA/AntB antirepressor family protein [Alphaproteobacteria bacterium]|nr:antA/AntB antirepressor family protein [Alphaproteobacteria bacterium]MBU0795552.1 antA/AntB antirepressor family protein [Alphaproteobacteria bacterium]MBU0874645.1 antA/AntB antirepressor family protein [Alphaproteobacteria bacterium]MBU1770053.1 antA/AntB antirepressor family protein [Alphaproteobacteria bacterium]
MFDARALHAWLGVKWQFNQWMRERLAEYGFEEGADFWCHNTKTGGRPRKDYLITIDMAKELAMIERTERGRETRQFSAVSK